MRDLEPMESLRDSIEKLSTCYNEKDGMPPVSGRIMNYLLLKPDGEATFDELTNYFNVSKSAISNSLKTLEQKQLIIAKTKHGQRKRYFKINLTIQIVIAIISEKQRSFKKYLEEITQIKSEDQELYKELVKILDFISLLEGSYPDIVKKFENNQTNSHS